jgi:putative iron-regulated protein
MSYYLPSKISIAVLATSLIFFNNVYASADSKQTQKADVITNYANIALATYEDALTQAQALHQAIENLVSVPIEKNLDAAKVAWLAARVPYLQSEAYRFGNPVVDAWEGKVNAWPLDEGLIDYVDVSYGTGSDDNDLYLANVIDSQQIFINGEKVDVSNITPYLISNTLHEADEVESNVASGYHAIEFLLWGQDLNGTNAGAGSRPASDYDIDNCNRGNCLRRSEYLLAVSTLLQEDLGDIISAWEKEGEARTDLTDLPINQALDTMITGMGSLSYGELAGERIKLGLMLHDPEEEQDCFSDNTHNSHYYDAKSIQNVYLGRYIRVDGSLVAGESLSNLVAQGAPQLDKHMQNALASTMIEMQTMVERANTIESYDQMIGSGNVEGNQVVQNVVDALTAQTLVIEKLAPALGLQKIAFEGSQSLDNPRTVK